MEILYMHQNQKVETTNFWSVPSVDHISKIVTHMGVAYTKAKV